MSDPVQTLTVERLEVRVFGSEEHMARAAAANTARLLTRATAERGHARVIVATGNSQLRFTHALREHPEIPWDRVTVFHMDEYLGVPAEHPASFRRWLRERIVDPFGPEAMHYLDGDAPDPHAECRRYEDLLRAEPVDLVCMGIGENGHIAFNDPPVADFADQVWVKVVELDDACRRQQVGEGHFPTVADVPGRALTLTVPALLAPAALQIVVPDARKADAVRDALRGPVATACPASILRRQPHAVLFCDSAAASKLG